MCHHSVLLVLEVNHTPWLCRYLRDGKNGLTWERRGEREMKRKEERERGKREGERERERREHNNY